MPLYTVQYKNIFTVTEPGDLRVVRTWPLPPRGSARSAWLPGQARGRWPCPRQSRSHTAAQPAVRTPTTG